MKLLVSALATFFIALALPAYTQSLVYHENFEPSSGADSVSSVPSGYWSVTSSLAASGLSSDSCAIKTGDTTYLTTNAFSTSGLNYVILEFDQICKTEFFDGGYIEVSVNNGASWTRLTGSHYLGNGNFTTLTNRFSGASYNQWDVTNNYAIPQNSWWRHEIFDISSLAANHSSVKLRFALADMNGTGAAGAYGWLLDNLEVSAAIDELIPPTIVMSSSNVLDSAFFFGPYDISAQVSDNSGVDSVLLIYARNGAPNDTVAMTLNYGNTYTARIDTTPAFSLYDTVCYHVWAMDSSLVHNTAVNPASGCLSFVVYPSQPYPGCSNALSSFPYLESFDQNFTAGNGNPSNPGTLDSLWSRQSNTSFQWLVYSGSTPSSSTGPGGDHSSGSGNYLYTEASYGSGGDQAVLLSPCFDLTNINAPVLEFYYHMYGQNMGELHVDIWYGNSWAYDIMPPISGDQGNQWHKASAYLSPYKGITKIRFRAKKGSSYASDIAIDDVKIWEPPANDAGVASIDYPLSPANTGTNPVHVTFGNYGSAPLTKVHINWQVNGQSQTPFLWTGTLNSGQLADSVQIGSYNFISGPSNIKVWTSAPNDTTDGFPYNDTAQLSIIACSAPLHGAFTVGGSAADFNTLNDALFALENCGIDSAIVLYINPGTYYEQLDIDSISGASAQNTVTFRSATGDSTDVLLTYAPNSSQAPYVVRFNGSSFIRFQNISVSATGSYGRLFVFENDASHNHIENCLLSMPSGSYYYTTAFYSTSGNSQYNHFINNDIANGYYGIYFRGSSSSNKAKGNLCVHNHFHGYRYYGAYFYYQDSLIFTDNILRNDTTASFSYSFYLYYGEGPIQISRNQLYTYGSSSLYGLRLFYCTASANMPIQIDNNIISLSGTTSSSTYGLYVYNVNHAEIYFNSVATQTATAVNSRTAYVYSGSNIKLLNNVFSNHANGLAIYTGTTSSILSSDYNCFYSNGTVLAYWNGNRNDLIALQNASGKEQHSISLQPAFISPLDLHMSNGQLNNLGTPVPGITLDVDGETRSANHPAIGADEKPPIPIDAGIEAIISPDNSEAEADTIPVKGLIKNYGTDTLHSLLVSYSLNGTTINSVQWTGSLLPLQNDTITLGLMVISPGSNTLCMKTTLNGDTNTYNDSLCKYFYGIPIVDMGVVEMLSPDSGQCYTSNESLQVKIKNYGSQSINFASKPLTIHTSVLAPNSMTIPDVVLNTGSMTPGQTTNINITNTLNISQTGDYFFNIWTSVAGDGEPGNDSIPTKKISVFQTVNNYPYSQNFENFVPSANSQDPGQLIEGWAQNSATGSYMWYVGSGSTYTSGTGPSFDHTTGNGTGKYLYAEAASYATGNANLVSPCLDLSNMTHPALQFWYFMYGNSIHSLRVDVFAGGQWHSSLGFLMGQHQSSSADGWKKYIVNLSPFAGQIIKIRFRAIKTSGYNADIAIDDVFLFEPVQSDAGINDHFIKPAGTFAAAGTQLPVKVKIENYGLDTITDLWVGYRVQGVTPVLEHWTGSILPYGSEDYQFSVPYTVQAGEVFIKAFTSMSGDMSPSNDTGTYAFTGIPTFGVPYTDSFEGNNYFVTDGGQKQWQRGDPAKNIFNNAHSGQNAWVTSLFNHYLNNSNDYLYTPYFNLSTFPNVKLRIWHRMDSEAGADGGAIEYTTDGGQTFLNLGYMSDPAATHWYNTNIGGSHSWSGPDSGWVQSTYDLASLNLNSTVQFRFKFFSDNSINSGDGWMIDDFEISPDPIATDAGIEAIISPHQYTTPGSSVQVKVRIKNYGTTVLSQIPVNYRINGGNVITQNWMGSLSPGAGADFTFTSPYNAPASYTLEAWTSLANDSHWYNDSTQLVISHDAGVSAIISPKPTGIIGDSSWVTVIVNNFGFDTLYSMDMYYDANGGMGTTETWTGMLAPGESMLFTFQNKFQIQYGSVNLCSKTLLNGDTDAANDKKCAYITGSLGIDSKANEQQQSRVSITPNPFKNTGILSVKLQQPARLLLRINDLNGRQLQSLSVEGHQGLNQIKIQRKGMASGMYHYQLIIDNQIFNGKFSLVD